MKKSEKTKADEFSKHFLAKKRLCEPKKEPVWVYLEKEMQENSDKKPYNKKVGEWLKFQKDLKRYYHQESKKQERILKREIGPPWYVEMSGVQKVVLKDLTKNIHYDLIDEMPTRTRKALSELGLNRNIPKHTLLKIMKQAEGDAAVFMWKLYTAIYNQTPSEPRGEYDMDAVILMSALTCIDMDECVKTLKELTKPAKEKDAPVKTKKVKKATKNTGGYGMYLDQVASISVTCRHPSPQRQNVKKPEPRMENKITLRSEDSYERLRMDNSFLNRRLQRCVKAKQVERVCTYKFWEPPAYLLSRDPAMAEYYKRLRIIQKPAKAYHLTEYDNIEYNVGAVVLVGGRLRYLLNNISILPTGYIPIHGGIVPSNTGEYLTVIAGFWKYPIEKEEKCDEPCECIEWESEVIKHLENSKCKCKHFYDFNLEGKSREKYFYPPTKQWPMWFDEAKVFQMDPTEDFIKETVRLAERSQSPTPDPSHPDLSASGIKTKALVQSFLGDLSTTPLVIPHLPKAELLNNLQEFVRKRFNGPLAPETHKRSIVRSSRRWLWLKHVDFRERAGYIPFTKQELKNITWSNRPQLQYLFETLLRDFTARNRLRQLEQTRLWWSTMKFDRYPSQAFLDIYFTYMPGRLKDTYIFNPFNAALTPRNISKACPLK